ncbi:MAG: hypothetical protein Fur0018_18340 [Anaerolineales bacterium]
MDIIVAIPHYFSAQGGTHASQRGARQVRQSALSACLSALHTVFGAAQGIIHIAGRRALPANQRTAHRLQVYLVTDGEHHLLDDLVLPDTLYTHAPQVVANPRHLGFACQRLLAENLGAFDYYVYLEDDLILHDPLFFHKLAWFTTQAGDDCLLQPNRYEVSPLARLHKVYVDGDLRPEVTAPFQDVTRHPEVRALILGQELRFVRPLNPHSGCAFLNAAQMRRWAAAPDFGKPDEAFIGPLESAATLGVMRHFRVYKPAPENAAFLEVQHYGTGFISLLGGEVRL